MRKQSAHFIFTLFAMMLLWAACARAPRSIDPNVYTKEIEQWRAERLAGLTSETGWLTLIGLFWLKDGRNTLGSDPTNDIVLAKDKLPARAGSFSLANGVVTFVTPLANTFTAEGQPVTSLHLKTDADDRPTVLTLGSVTFQIIKRNDKFGVRVKDKNNPDRTNFRGLENYPVSLKWRIDARFEPYNPPKAMPILNVLGMESDEPSPGAIVFEIDGKSYRLDAVSEKGEPKFFMIFADDTRGKETYGAGRYLYVDPPDAAGHVVIDFNKAYSPPCAFTNYATCPLPPKQNILPVAIEAGEKFKGHPG
ncbi:MAG TPA: DUF1684 domain-containing protein [Pyrinomonadaceae bacterium]|nr:DUF1684 domain-containing protein [Pyrinomonadaceae bacterium]